MIFGHGQNNNFDESMVSYNNIRHEGLCADMATFVTLASSCTGHECSVHAHAIRSGFGADMIVENAILDSVLRSGASKDDMNLFEKLKVKTIISLTTIIYDLGNTCFNLDSETMHCMGIWSNGFTFSSVSKSWSNLADISLGRCIYGAIIKLGSRDAFTNCALINICVFKQVMCCGIT